MHEFSTTSSIVETIINFASEQNIKKIVEVKLEIGSLTMLGLEQVRFCYDMIVKDTILEGSKLTITQVNGKISCDRCGYKGDIATLDNMLYHIAVPTLQCPRCGKTGEIIDGNQCTIKSLRFEDKK